MGTRRRPSSPRQAMRAARPAAMPGTGCPRHSLRRSGQGTLGRAPEHGRPHRDRGAPGGTGSPLPRSTRKARDHDRGHHPHRADDGRERRTCRGRPVLGGRYPGPAPAGPASDGASIRRHAGPRHDLSPGAGSDRAVSGTDRAVTRTGGPGAGAGRTRPVAGPPVQPGAAASAAQPALPTRGPDPRGPDAEHAEHSAGDAPGTHRTRGTAGRPGCAGRPAYPADPGLRARWSRRHRWTGITPSRPPSRSPRLPSSRPPSRSPHRSPRRPPSRPPSRLPHRSPRRPPMLYPARIRWWRRCRPPTRTPRWFPTPWT